MTHPDWQSVESRSTCSQPVRWCDESEKRRSADAFRVSCMSLSASAKPLSDQRHNQRARQQTKQQASHDRLQERIA